MFVFRFFSFFHYLFSLYTWWKKSDPVAKLKTTFVDSNLASFHHILCDTVSSYSLCSLTFDSRLGLEVQTHIFFFTVLSAEIAPGSLFSSQPLHSGIQAVQHFYFSLLWSALYQVRPSFIIALQPFRRFWAVSRPDLFSFVVEVLRNLEALLVQPLQVEFLPGFSVLHFSPFLSWYETLPPYE